MFTFGKPSPLIKPPGGTKAPNTLGYKASTKANPYPKTTATDCNRTKGSKAVRMYYDGEFSLATYDENYAPESLKHFKSFLNANEGKISHVEMIVYDCSEAYYCDPKSDPLNSSEVGEFTEEVQQLLQTQKLAANSNVNISVRRAKTEVWSHGDTPWELDLVFKYDYCKSEQEEEEENNSKNGKKKQPAPPTPTPVRPKRTVHPRMKDIQERIKMLDQSVTYRDPITNQLVTRPLKETLYGIGWSWYLHAVKESCESDFYAFVSETLLEGKPHYVECYDSECFGNKRLSLEQWQSLTLEDRVNYYNDGLDERIQGTANHEVKAEFHKRVRDALYKDLIPIDSWYTGVLQLPSSKRILDFKVYSSRDRLRRSQEDWQLSEQISGHHKDGYTPDERQHRLWKAYMGRTP